MKEKGGRNMSMSKIVAMMALIAFALGILLVGDVVAGEYFKCRGVYHTTKWEQINVGDEKDHVVAVSESKGMYSNMEGKTFGEGWLGVCVGFLDISPKTGPIGNGYVTMSDTDGNKAYLKYDQKGFSGEWAFFKGTGMFEGIRGKGIYFWTPTADSMQGYVDLEGEVELP
jgi:hypothetical protein